MTTHRFVQIDDLTTGKTHVTELMAGDTARIYPAEVQTLLAMGKTVRIGDTLHCDLQAFLQASRALPQAMTRPPVAAAQPCAAFASRRAPAPIPSPTQIPSVATSAEDLADLMTPPRADQRILDRVILGLT